jgi:hypothetical protein
MAKYSLISVKGSVENIRNLVQQAFASNGFVIRWESQTKGRAEKGSMGANIALGVWAQHYAVDFDIVSGAEGGTLRLMKTGSGMAGGLLGMRKVNKQFDLLSDTLASWFTHQGLLLSVRKE